jgi:hypothetical protein
MAASYIERQSGPGRLSMGFAIACVIATLGIVASPACRAPTEITIEISTDVKCTDLRGTAITVGDLSTLDAKPVTTVTAACDQSTGRIGSMVIVPSGANDDTVAMKLVLGIGRDPAECVPPAYGAGCIVARRALRFIPNSSLKVPIFLAAVCSGITCDATRTCSGGSCAPATIEDPSKCEEAAGCSEGVLGPSVPPAPTTPPADAGAPDVVDAAVTVPDASPCAAGASCDVIASTTIVDVAVTATALFWLDSRGMVMTSALDGSSPRVVVTGQPPVAGLEADSANVYWSAGGLLRSSRISDGALLSYASNAQAGCLRWLGPPGVQLLAAQPGSGTVFILDYVKGTATGVIGNALAPWGVAGTSLTDIFYTNSATTGAIRHNDGTQTVSATIASNQNVPRCMAKDGTSIWWANNGAGTLVQSTTTGQNLQTLATGQTGINGIALDATFIYWSWQGGIRKRAR